MWKRADVPSLLEGDRKDGTFSFGYQSWTDYESVEIRSLPEVSGDPVCQLCARFLKQQLRRVLTKHPIRNALRSGFLYCEARLARRSRAHNINRGRIKVPGVSPPAGQHLLAGWHKINGRPAGPRAAPRKACADH